MSADRKPHAGNAHDVAGPPAPGFHNSSPPLAGERPGEGAPRSGDAISGDREKTEPPSSNLSPHFASLRGGRGVTACATDAGTALRGYDPRPALSRRHFLWQSGGMGAMALAWMLNRETQAAAPGAGPYPGAASAKPPHHPPRAKRVLYIFAPGGVSHIDTFDYKPELARRHGKPLDREVDTFFGQPGNIMKSPWKFARYGQSGQWVSSLLPNLATCVDELAIIRSMTTSTNNHTPAAFQMNSGFTMNGFPSIGAWVTYGLGSMNDNLPSYVVLPDPRGLPAGGSINWTAGFLPARYQGTAFNTSPDAEQIIEDLQTPDAASTTGRRAATQLLDQTNRDFAEQDPGNSELNARVRSYELAARMQMAVPEVLDFDDEPAHTQSLYGLDDDTTAPFGRTCLMARRLLERGVRFVQLFAGASFGQPRINWDGHEDVIRNHNNQAAVIDRPLAGLIKDLVQRGLLEDTLVVFCTEFGRTPITEGVDRTGRDHHPEAFTGFLAGAGVQKGLAYGASDELGFDAVENAMPTHDFHATILYLLGLQHTQLTYYHNGILRRLTDVHGHIHTGLFA